MSKRIKVLITTTLCVAIATSMLIGCTKKKENEGTANKSGTETQTSYPLKTNTTLTYWSQINVNVSASKQSLNDTEFAKELEKRTGVKVNYIHPATGQGQEQFNIMIAAGEYPDIIEYDWMVYPGGPEKAIKDGVLINHNEVLDKYAPNLKKTLKTDVIVDKMSKTDSGSYFSFPMLKLDDLLTVNYGPMMRADWLKELGLEVPTTVDEWEKVLKAFKEQKGATAPLSMDFSSDKGHFANSFLVGAYGVAKNFYNDNGKVKYGPMENGYKEFLTTLNKWYNEGLFDKNFPTSDGKVLPSNMMNNKSGATIGWIGGGMGTWLNGMKDKDPKFDLVAVPYPTLKKGETPKFGQKALKVGANAAITTACKDVSTAAKFLDYGYTEEGNMLYNFGIENESYKMENGYPKFTETITKNSEKLSMSQAIARYARSSYAGPFVQRKEYIEQFYQLPQQANAIKVYSKSESIKYNMPPISPLPEEASEASKIDSEIGTYVDEMFIKFILGKEPISNFDKYVEQLKKMNIEKGIKIRQDALDRFNKR